MNDSDRTIDNILAPTPDGTVPSLVGLTHTYNNHKGKDRKCFWLKDLIRVMAFFHKTAIGKVCFDFLGEGGSALYRADPVIGAIYREQAERIAANPSSMQAQMALEGNSESAMALTLKDEEMKLIMDERRVKIEKERAEMESQRKKDDIEVKEREAEIKFKTMKEEDAQKEKGLEIKEKELEIKEKETDLEFKKMQQEIKLEEERQRQIQSNETIKKIEEANREDIEIRQSVKRKRETDKAKSNHNKSTKTVISHIFPSPDKYEYFCAEDYVGNLWLDRKHNLYMKQKFFSVKNVENWTDLDKMLNIKFRSMYKCSPPTKFLTTRLGVDKTANVYPYSGIWRKIVNEDFKKWHQNIVAVRGPIGPGETYN